MMYGGVGRGELIVIGIILLLLAIAAVVIIALIIAAVSRSRRGTGTGMWGAGPEDPVKILKARYAKGEITKEQYEQMLDDLTKDRGVGT